jgi:hypothetical protein
MKRREFITLLGGAAATWPHAVRAQQPAKVKRIGLLRGAPQPEHELTAFLRALAERGYVQGRNFVLVPQVGDGSPGQLPELAAALVNQGVDIIVTEGGLAVRAAAGASSTIPIVTASAADPFLGGLVKNLSHPGGNITGFVSMERDISSKVFGILKEMLPALGGLPSWRHARFGPCSRRARTRPQRRSVSNIASSTCRNRKRSAPPCVKPSLKGRRALWCVAAHTFRLYSGA